MILQSKQKIKGNTPSAKKLFSALIKPDLNACLKGKIWITPEWCEPCRTERFYVTFHIISNVIRIQNAEDAE